MLEALDEDEEEDDDEGSSPDIRKFIMFIKFHKLKFKKKVEDAKCDRLFKTNLGNGIFRKNLNSKKCNANIASLSQHNKC